MTALSHQERLLGCLIGTAVGDALLLPYEGLSAARIAKRYPSPLRHRFIGGRGMLSDDTEHTIFVAQSWLRCAGDTERFSRSLAWRFRWWILCLPAGLGAATLKACCRLWLGRSPHGSGTYSAGNGAAMRSALLGILERDNPHQRAALVRASTVITHRDPRAYVGALAIAECTAWISQGRLGCKDSNDLSDLWARLQACAGEDQEWQAHLILVQTALKDQRDVPWLAERMDCSRGITGYVYHTVPAAIFVWLRYRGSGEAALSALAQAGGDTDTVGAIAGALLGTDTGEASFPTPWIQGICDAPLGLPYVRRVAEALSRPELPVPAWAWWAYPFRSLFFLMWVILWGFRRLLPW